MTAPAAGSPQRRPDRPTSRRGTGRLVGALAILGIGTWALGRWLGGEAGDPRRAGAAPFMLTADALAAASSVDRGVFRHTNPPIDMRLAERTAQGALLGRVGLPDARDLSSFHRADTGETITHAVLIYEDPAQAAALVAGAGPLLESTFRFASQAIALDGTEDARLWTADHYRAISFRQGGVVTLVGTNRADAADDVQRLAEAARDRAAAQMAARRRTPTP